MTGLIDGLEGLTDVVSGSPWTYLVVLLLVAGDAIVPLFPGESTVVAAGVLAADGELHVALVWAAAAAGALIGDTVMYLLGRRFGPRVVDRFVRGDKGRARLEAAEHQLDERGTGLIAAAQFIPGGRNLVMVGAGTLGFPLRRFLPAEAIGVTIWATFQTGLGYLGGRAFERTITALLVSLGIAIVVGVAVERIDDWRRRRRAARGGAPEGG